jgi:signal transduction histidine kinase
VFVALFALVEIGTLGYRYFNRTRALISLEAIRIADRVTVMTSLMEGIPAQQRAAVSAQSKGSGLEVLWSPKPWPASKLAKDEEASLLRDLLLKVRPEIGAQDILVGLADSDAGLVDKGQPASMWQTDSSFSEPVAEVIEELAAEPMFYLSVRLSDGSWLNFVAAYVETLDFWPIKRIVLLSSLVMGVVGVSIWAIQRLTSPFRVFATAAARLGTDVNAEPLKEQGPSEVREAIQAFNEMQGRLKRFIADRTQMLAAVSHDLRTPITRMRLRSECLKDREQSAKFLADIGDMEDMIEGVLTFAKDDALSEPTIAVDLSAMLQSICDELTDRGFDVSFEHHARYPYLCRRVSLRRCFANLIDNAAKYGKRAVVTLEVRETEIIVRVEDFGPGIPEHFYDDVFRPFYRLEASRGRDSGGSGLGLTIARTAARAHGGDVLLQKAYSGGLAATVVLPKNPAGSSVKTPTTLDCVAIDKVGGDDQAKGVDYHLRCLPRTRH